MSDTAVRPNRRGLKARFNDAPIRNKILQLVTAGVVGCMMIGLLGTWGLLQARSSMAAVGDASADLYADAMALNDEVWRTRAAVLSLMAAEPEQIHDEIAKIEAVQAQADTAAATLFEDYTRFAGAELPNRETLESGREAYHSLVVDQLAPAITNGDRATAQQLRTGEAGRTGDALVAELTSTMAHVDAAVDTIRDDAYARATTTVALVGIVIAGVIVVCLSFGLLVAGRIRRPVETVRDALQSLAQGDLTAAVAITSKDEIGQMAAALRTAQHHLTATLSGVVETAQTVAASSEELAASNTQVAAGAEETSVQAGVVAAAAEQVSRNVQTVAAGAEQMGASIREIAQNASEAADVANRATTQAADATVTVTRLGTSSQEIGNVVKSITEISGVIAKINDYQLTIASAVEEQTATTNEMSRSVSEAATGSADIAVNIGGVAQATASSSDALSGSGGTIDELAAVSTTLRERIAGFTI